jgi:hypothetical protein
VDSHATEVQIREGHFKSEGGHGKVRLNLDVVDMDGVMTSGEIVPGDDPVCITFELVIEEIRAVKQLLVLRLFDSENSCK